MKTKRKKNLSLKEEHVHMMSNGKNINFYAPLEKKTDDPILLEKLLELEASIIKRLFSLKTKK